MHVFATFISMIPLAALSAPPRPAMLRESALPLAGKRVLLVAPRTTAAPLASALVLAGARPLWCPLVRVEPLPSYADLDDALMRLTEYNVLITLSTHAIDSLAERFLTLADGNLELVAPMIEASKLEVGAVGRDALHFRQRLGVSPTVMPIEPTVRALGATLIDLGYVRAGAKVLVVGARADAPLADPPAGVARLLAQLRSAGAEATYVSTHALVPVAAADVTAELALLRAGGVDAVCVASAEEAGLVVGGDYWPATAPPFVVALGDEAAAAARESLGQRGGGGELEELGARPGEDAVVVALEKHFGGGRLLF